MARPSTAIARGDTLNLDATDHRRLAFAAAFTIIALPAIWLFTRGEATTGSGAPTIAAVGIDTPAGSAGAADLGTGDEPVNALGSNSPIFIDGPTTPPKPAVIQIVVPAAIEGDYTEGGATYKTNADVAPDTCSAPNAPFGATLTVTNRDNGRSIVCINRAPIGLTAGLEIQLNTTQFSEIGRVADAPIPVRITWNGSE